MNTYKVTYIKEDSHGYCVDCAYNMPMDKEALSDDVEDIKYHGGKVKVRSFKMTNEAWNAFAVPMLFNE